METLPTNVYRGLRVVMFVVACGACATKAPPPPATAPVPRAETSERPTAMAVHNTSQAGPCQLESVHFDFDSSDLDEKAKEVLARDQRCAREKGAESLRVVGMTDPRGTEEYNLALGDRRAQNAARYLNALGAPAPEATSMGSIMAKGEDEIGWAYDRRTEVQLK